MHILPRYAKLSDLNKALKWKFTIEDLIGNNERVRAVYRKYFFLPNWVKGTIGGSLVFTGIVPLLLAGLCDEAAKKVVDKHYDGSLGIWFYIVGVLVFSYFHIMGLVLAGLTLWSVFWFWLCCVVMDEYDKELRKEVQDGTWSEAVMKKFP